MASEGNSSDSSTAKLPQGDSASAKSPIMLGPGFSVPPGRPTPLAPSPKLALARPGPVGVDPSVRAGRRNRLLEPDDDTGWEKYIHLDGSIYYQHVPMRFLIPDDVTQPRIRECIWKLLTLIRDTLTEHNLLHKLPPDFEVVAERMDPEVPEVFYFVSQRLGQVINYVSNCPCQDPSHLINVQIQNSKTPTTSFWKHIASYPMHVQSLPDNCESEFLKALTHGVNDARLPSRYIELQTLRKPQSASLMSGSRCFPIRTNRRMQVYRDLKSSAPYGHERYYSVLPAFAWHISRVMHKIETVRERYHYDVLLFCVLFNSHRTYNDRPESTWPKGHVYLPDFRELKKSLLVEWLDSDLLATVFVSANVAFPALPVINALAQIASLTSTLFSMLPVVIGVHHVWRHRQHVDGDDEDASWYPRLRPHGHRASLTLLACLLTLPLAARSSRRPSPSPSPSPRSASSAAQTCTRARSSAQCSACSSRPSSSGMRGANSRRESRRRTMRAALAWGGSSCPRPGE
ncbi:hypothetical protein EDB86DRAFT_3098166 [Lactarius hatsudake]|nr:hypothetical protein EDB86DRAFT_3098166 [Lactarius hatsudake]